MPIQNNLILINGSPLRPVPNFNIEYETYKAGHYVIGGVMNLSLTGEIYGTSIDDLNDKVKVISGYSAKCQSIKISCDNKTIVDGVGYISQVSVSPTDQPFSVSYTMSIEISNVGSSTLAVAKDDAFTSLFGISSNVNLSKFEESLSLSADDNMLSTVFYVNQGYTKAAIKLGGSITVQGYHHMCDNSGGSDYTNKIYQIANARIKKILTLDPSLSVAYPVLSGYIGSGWTAIAESKKVDIDEINHKVTVSFDMFIFKGNCAPSAKTQITVNETKDHTTGFSSWSVKGSIQGYPNTNTNGIIDTSVLSPSRYSNAKSVFNTLFNQRSTQEYLDVLLTSCGEAASAPPNVCWQRVSSQIQENFQAGSISFDMSYGDVEFCQIGGATVDVSISEDHPAYKHVEHIIPGRGVALVQIGENLTPFKVSITAEGRLNSCDTSRLNELINIVRNRFFDTINDNGYNSNVLQSENITTGKYSYKIVRNYIGCV